MAEPPSDGPADPQQERAPPLATEGKLHDFTAQQDRLFFEQVKERAVRDEDVRRMAQANTYDKFALGFRP